MTNRNRIARKSGKKANGAQSTNAPEKIPGKTQSKPVDDRLESDEEIKAMVEERERVLDAVQDNTFPAGLTTGQLAAQITEPFIPDAMLENHLAVLAELGRIRSFKGMWLADEAGRGQNDAVKLSPTNDMPGSFCTVVHFSDDVDRRLQALARSRNISFREMFERTVLLGILEQEQPKINWEQAVNTTMGVLDLLEAKLLEQFGSDIHLGPNYDSRQSTRACGFLNVSSLAQNQLWEAYKAHFERGHERHCILSGEGS